MLNTWQTQEKLKRRFTLPNELFSLELNSAEISIYAYLLYCEDRKTHQCWPSYLAIPVVLCVPAKEAHDMAKVLKDLFYGDLSLSDRSMPKGSAMHKLSTKLCKCEETLGELLDEEGKEQLEVLARAQWEMDCLTAEENFILGFRLGVRIMAECLTGEEDV